MERTGHQSADGSPARPLDKRREAMLRAALSVFGRRGYHPAQMEEIAQKAGVGKGTLYHHFEGKEALLREALLYLMDLSHTQWQARLVGVTDPLEKLYHMVYTEYSIVSSHLHAARVVFTEAPGVGFSPAFRSTMQAAIKRRRQQVSQLMQEGQEQGLLRADIAADMLALVFMGMAREMGFDLLFQDGPRQEPEQVARTVLTIFLEPVQTG